MEENKWREAQAKNKDQEELLTQENKWREAQAKKKDEEELLTQLDKLRAGVGRLRSEWDLAQAGKVERFAEGEIRTKAEAERYLRDTEKLTVPSPPRDGVERIRLESRRSATISSVQRLNNRIDYWLERRTKKFGSGWWARELDPEHPTKAEKLRQRIEELEAKVEDHRAWSNLPYHPLFDQDIPDADPLEDTARDAGPIENASARLVIRESSSGGRLFFECDEIQKELKTGVENLRAEGVTAEDFDYLNRMQRFEPQHLTARGNVEWWWFEDKFYKMAFEEGQPSEELAEALAAGDSSPKKSLDGFQKVGYSPEELVAGVFETRGKEESGFERALRADKAAAIRNQWATISFEAKDLDEQQSSRSEMLEPDLSAKLFGRRTDTSTQVCFESSAHQPPLILPINEEELKLASKLQNYHPLLVARLVGRGSARGSEAVAEWWWFKGIFHVAKRRRDYRSNVLAQIVRQQTSKRDSEYARLTYGWARASIPKLAVGEVTADIYEDGHAPEEISRLVFDSQGKQEKIGEKFDRIQAAKDLLSRSPLCDDLWGEEADAFYRRDYEKYLQARMQGYRGDYKQWILEQIREDARYWDRRLASESRDNKGSYQGDEGQEERHRILGELDGRDRDLDDVNYMEGWEFERFMADVLRRSGYTVESTQLSGDQGVDMLLDVEGRKVAVQLKRYTRPVGNKAIQEVLAGRVHYAAHEAWVITTSSFTRHAVELARSTGVRLIDGNELSEWLIELKSEQV